MKDWSRWLIRGTVLGIVLVGILFSNLGGAVVAADNPVVIMETSLGTITIELNKEKAPITVENFLKYVDDKHYDGVLFHRVIPTFMIQGGGFEAGLKERETRAPIKNESGNGLSNMRGSIAMARTRELDSASAQFFINVVDNQRLDGLQYCVFGKVTGGMDVVDKIKAVETRDVGPHEKVPVQDVIIKSVRRKQ